MWSIRQTENGWEIVGPDGQVRTVDGQTSWSKYEHALAKLGPLVQSELAAGDAAAGEDPNAGLLLDGWTTDNGVGFSELTGDGRDFTEVVWSWRDPAESLLPLMFQDSTEMGHFSAVLAGFIETLEDRAGTMFMGGRFYDRDAGRELHEILAGGRRFGVSLDAGQVEASFVCTEEDEEGWCIDGSWSFQAYEIIGLTATPFPAFARASIIRSGIAAEPAQAEQPMPAGDAALVASAVQVATRPVVVTPMRQSTSGEFRFPIAPPREWLTMAEPEVGDERLIEQRDGSLAVPLTITDDGQVFGHVAYWGQCHTGYLDACVTPPLSSDDYAGFRIGVTRCDDQTEIATGALIAGCDHAVANLRAGEARDHYAHNGLAWADVVVVNGDLGPWACGALRPDIDDLQLRALRASSLSGDWRDIDGQLDMIAGLAVNVPGFPITRSLAASALMRPAARTSVQFSGDRVVSLTAAGIVQPCPECARRRALGQSEQRDPGMGEVLDALSVLRGEVAKVERRTRHMTRDAVTAAAGRIRG